MLVTRPMLAGAVGDRRRGTATQSQRYRDNSLDPGAHPRHKGDTGRHRGAMGYPAYYGRPALVASYRRQSAPATVRTVAALHYLGGLLTLLLAVAVAGIWHGDLSWPAVTGASPQLRRAVAERGLTLAGSLLVLGLLWLIVARNLRRGRRLSRALVLTLSGL